MTAWSSALSVSDFASCEAAGMEPVGFVQGCAVMQWGWYLNSYSQGMGGAPAWMRSGSYLENWNCPHGFVGGEHRSYGFNYEQTWVERNWSTGWSLAYQRMLAEASALGAHGVIGVVDDMHQMTGGTAAEFKIRGTAVVVPGATPPTQPFTTFLSGSRLIKLIEAGFTPVSVAATLSSVQMIAYCITHYQLSGTSGGWGGSWGTAGAGGIGAIAQVESAQQAARHLAREHIRQQLGEDLLHGASLHQFDHEIGEGCLAIQCQIKGTRVRRYKDFDPIPEPRVVVRLS